MSDSTGAEPRVGDGCVRVDAVRSRASSPVPTPSSAFRRLGLTTDLVGAHLGMVSGRIARRTGAVDASLALVAGGRLPGEVELTSQTASVTVRSLPLRHAGRTRGALVLVRDVTELRRRERALLSKDATIREIHHRVKNNLQTVAALLRLQARRLADPGAAEALAEAERRVAAIAVVHDLLAQSGAEEVPFDDGGRPARGHGAPDGDPRRRGSARGPDRDAGRGAGRAGDGAVDGTGRAAGERGGARRPRRSVWTAGSTMPGRT